MGRIRQNISIWVRCNDIIHNHRGGLLIDFTRPILTNPPLNGVLAAKIRLLTKPRGKMAIIFVEGMM